jgi:hypothetical protein
VEGGGFSFAKQISHNTKLFRFNYLNAKSKAPDTILKYQDTFRVDFPVASRLQSRLQSRLFPGGFRLQAGHHDS